MADPLPVSFEVAAFPPSESYTPQEFADALAERLSLVSQQDFALFVTGSVEPSSDVGPWLKDGIEWWVWDTVNGNYKPIEINQGSLKYIISQATPDTGVYQVWYKLDGSNVPQSIYVNVGGTWTDAIAGLYYNKTQVYTQAQTNTAIATAIGSIPTPPGTSLHPGVSTTSGQTEAAGPSYHAIAGFSYVAPVTGAYLVSASIQVDDSGMVLSDVTVFIRPTVNGVTAGAGGFDSGNTPSGSRWNPRFCELVSANAGETISAEFSPDSPSGSAAVSNGKMSVIYCPA